MANRVAAGNGNWSDVATWDGGAAIPAAGDNVALGAYAVVLDTATIPATGTLGAITATTGKLTLDLSTRSVTLSAALITAGTVPILEVSGAGGANVFTLNAPLVGGSATSAYGMAASHTSTGAGGIRIVGAVSGGPTNTTTHGVLNTGTGSVSITGNVTGGAASSCGLRCNAASTCAITGNITGGSHYGAVGVSNQLATSVINLAATCNLIDSTGLAWAGTPPAWTPTAANYWTHVGSRFAKEVWASDIRFGVVNGLTVGTLDGVIETDGTPHNVGVISDLGAYHSTGVLAADFSYATLDSALVTAGGNYPLNPGSCGSRNVKN